MANDINNVYLSGRLAADPAVNDVQGKNGLIKLMKFPLANSLYRSSGITNFFDCEMWGKSAEYYADKLKKGMFIVLFGSLKQNKWQDKTTGQQRSKISINVNMIVSYSHMQARPAEKDASSNIEIISEDSISGDSLDPGFNSFPESYDEDSNNFYNVDS